MLRQAATLASVAAIYVLAGCSTAKIETTVDAAKRDTGTKLLQQWYATPEKMTLDDVLAHNSIPRKLYELGDPGKDVLLLMRSSRIASSDQDLVYWQAKSMRDRVKTCDDLIALSMTNSFLIPDLLWTYPEFNEWFDGLEGSVNCRQKL